MTVPASSRTLESFEARTDFTAQLLLLLARNQLSDEQSQEVRRLAQHVEDWDEFASISGRKFSATYAFRHLSQYAADLVPPNALSKLLSLSTMASLSTLRVVAAQLHFHRKCIEPTSAKYAYVKGIALSLQCGAQLSDRYCRDIDVLVSADNLLDVLVAASEAGYQFLLEDELVSLKPGSPDLKFLARFADVITIFGSDGVPIEVHRRLDKLSLNFDLEMAKSLGGLVDVELSGVSVKTLSESLHFVYACYHHSRHFWSHLHWLADIDGFLSSPGFDQKAVSSIADAIGITPSVDAAIKLRTLTSRPGQWRNAIPQESGGGRFLTACLINLDGDLELEVELREGIKLGDFMSAWQISRGKYKGLWRNSWVRRLKPSVSQYVEHRYPSYLYWVYSVSNGFKLATNGIGVITRALMRAPDVGGRNRSQSGTSS